MQFKLHQQLAGIFFDSGEMIKVGENFDAITVSMEDGQMSGVPWFAVWKDGKIVSKWNAAKCVGVLYLSDVGEDNEDTKH